jgi:site-specific DNA-adenine methylase
LPTSSYPYWNSSLIGAQDTAAGYSKLVEDTNTFFYVFPSSVPIYSTATEMAGGFTSFNGTQKQNVITVIKHTEKEDGSGRE